MITRIAIIIGMLSAVVLSPGTGALALEPGEVLVVVNAAVPAGAELAAYYMKQRGDPGREHRAGVGPGRRDDQPQTVR